MALEERIKKSRVEEGGGEPSSGSTLDRQNYSRPDQKKQRHCHLYNMVICAQKMTRTWPADAPPSTAADWTALDIPLSADNNLITMQRFSLLPARLSLALPGLGNLRA
jgi:hypothetical protein